MVPIHSVPLSCWRMGAFYKVNAQDFPATIYYTPFAGTVGTQYFRTCYPFPKVWDLLYSSVADFDVIAVGHVYLPVSDRYSAPQRKPLYDAA